MAVLPLLKEPHDFLRQKSHDVDVFDDNLKNFIQDLFDTMDHSKGCGLAAPQVHCGKNIFVTFVDNERRVFINPRITPLEEEMISFNEGCLSVPEFFAPIQRFRHISVAYQDLEGNHHEEKFSDFMAVCAQHENDHLQGILFVDRLNTWQRMKFRKFKEKCQWKKNIDSGEILASKKTLGGQKS